MPTSSDPLANFTRSSFTFEGERKAVYEAGHGPGVVVMSEVPGITPAVARFATRVVDAGFSVAMPELFGVAGKKPTLPYAANTIARACISREFQVLAARQSSPVIDWCRALARDLHARCGGPGVGAVGMCLTGNFALTMMLDDCMLAPVLAQPSLPFAVGRKRSAALHIAPAALAQVAKTAAENDRRVLAMRFTHDRMCPKERFDSLRSEFGRRAELIEIDSGPKNRHGNPIWAHSVLTEHLVDQQGHPTRAALDRVLTFFDERLRQ